MSSSAHIFLKKTLGEDFEEIFKTEIYKPGTRSVVDTSDMHLGLKLVPKTLMAFLVKELVPMAVGENKELKIPHKNNVIMNVVKNEKDAISGQIIENNKKIAEFINRSIPGVGLVLLSSLELYDVNLLTEKEEYKDVDNDISEKVNRIIEERLALHDLVGKIVDKKIEQKDALNQLFLQKLVHEFDVKKEQVKDVIAVHKNGTPEDDDYFRGMTNGMEVVNSIVNDAEPDFVPPVKKEKLSPLREFIKKKNNKAPSFSIELSKNEKVNCPDCGNTIFNGSGISACICFGDSGKVHIKKSENGFKLSFGKSWEPENIQMLLEILRRKNAKRRK